MAVQADFINFMAAVNQIAAERNIDSQEVILAIKEAIEQGFRQNYETLEEVVLRVNIDEEQGGITVFEQREIVKKITNENKEILLKDALKYNDEALVGQIIELDITPQGDFGRVAAQSAKQAILQKIKDAERDTQLKEFENKIGEIEFAVVQRMDGENVLWEVGRTTALMKAEDRIPGEFYKSGNRYKVLLKEINETPRGRSLFVSRGSNDFLKALFMLEVPELTAGTIKIRSIAREAGSRSKIAVESTSSSIDPIGALVGQRGSRINSVSDALRIGDREEKIDVIEWDQDIVKFVSNSISPATALKVNIIDEKEKTAEIVVPEDQISLAIGRDGQNVRLAVKLTGWDLDIIGDGVLKEKPEKTESIEK